MGFTNPALLPAQQQQLEALRWKAVHLWVAAFVKALLRNALKAVFFRSDGVAFEVTF